MPWAFSIPPTPHRLLPLIPAKTATTVATAVAMQQAAVVVPVASSYEPCLLL